MIRRFFAIRYLVALAVAAAAGAVFAGDKPPKDLPKCPVMGEPVDFSVSHATDQGPVFFCCPPCIKKYSKDPQKYAAAAAEQRAALADRPKIQVVCPVSGKAVDQKVSIEHEGKAVYFCCDKCPAEFQKDPAKYASKLANSFTYQTLCPVMNEEIDPAVSADLATGQKVYFCCKKCIDKFNQDPAKYVPNLESQGVHLDVEKLKG